VGGACVGVGGAKVVAAVVAGVGVGPVVGVGTGSVVAGIGGGTESATVVAVV
jgi:hypothetical protein